ncbi:MAG: hypothetical protein PVJ20_10565 [Desulfobacterales bacterium]|jgi:hypothetical protein
MKRKYHGLISIVIIAILLVPTAIYAVYFSQVFVDTDTIGLTKNLPEFTVPNQAVIKEISHLEKEMIHLVNPVESESITDRKIRFWQYSDQYYGQHTTTDSGNENVNSKTAYALTFTFASGEKKFCIIDGSFYTQSADLPDGGKIIKIEPGRVWVKKGDVTKWILLPETTKWGEMR